MTQKNDTSSRAIPDPDGIHQKRLDGKVALVTGAGQNIGQAIALRLAEIGARVIVNGLTREKLDGTVRMIEEAGGAAHAIATDISDPQAVTEMIAEAKGTFGGIDISVSNVGRRLHMPFDEITVRDWDESIRINLSAAFYIAREVVPGMKEKNWGRIIHVSGYDGFTGHLVNRAYNIAAKSGLHGFSKALGKELGPYGITANTLVPGAINTERDWSQYPGTVVEDVRQAIPVRRWGSVDDLAYGAVYLCTTGSFVNGQALHLNGGEFMF
ncbi:MAG: SDR family oxidoreductase [Pararhodobacter sp.]|nr:SDR family oxidoreductase [Pararhodobacter sp.]